MNEQKILYEISMQPTAQKVMKIEMDIAYGQNIKLSTYEYYHI